VGVAGPSLSSCVLSVVSFSLIDPASASGISDVSSSSFGDGSMVDVESDVVVSPGAVLGLVLGLTGLGAGVTAVPSSSEPAVGGATLPLLGVALGWTAPEGVPPLGVTLLAPSVAEEGVTGLTGVGSLPLSSGSLHAPKATAKTVVSRGLLDRWCILIVLCSSRCLRSDLGQSRDTLSIGPRKRRVWRAR